MKERVRGKKSGNGGIMRKLLVIHEAANLDGCGDEGVEAGRMRMMLEDKDSGEQWEEWKGKGFGHGDCRIRLGRMKIPKPENTITNNLSSLGMNL